MIHRLGAKGCSWFHPKLWQFQSKKVFGIIQELVVTNVPFVRKETCEDAVFKGGCLRGRISTQGQDLFWGSKRQSTWGTLANLNFFTLYENLKNS